MRCSCAAQAGLISAKKDMNALTSADLQTAIAEAGLSIQHYKDRPNNRLSEELPMRVKDVIDSAYARSEVEYGGSAVAFVSPKPGVSGGADVYRELLAVHRGRDHGQRTIGLHRSALRPMACDEGRSQSHPEGNQSVRR